MIIVRTRLLSIIAKSQLQSDSTPEMFISFQNYCAAIIGDHVRIVGGVLYLQCY